MLKSDQAARPLQQCHAEYHSVNAFTASGAEPGPGRDAFAHVSRSEAARRFREEAARCFRWADSLAVRSDQDRLLQIGYEFEQRAIQAEASETPSEAQSSPKNRDDRPLSD